MKYKFPNYFSLSTTKNKNQLANQRSPIKLEDLLYEFIEEAWSCHTDLKVESSTNWQKCTFVKRLKTITNYREYDVKLPQVICVRTKLLCWATYSTTYFRHIVMNTRQRRCVYVISQIWPTFKHLHHETSPPWNKLQFISYEFMLMGFN